MENFKIYDYKDKKVVLKYLIGFYINFKPAIFCTLNKHL